MPRATIDRLVGVYNAEGTLRGELAYWVGKRLGRAHCGLCDITHGSVRMKAEWKRCRAGMPVAFHTYHADDQPDEIRPVTSGTLPVVVAMAAGAPFVLLGPEELDACGGSPAQLVAALEAAATRLQLQWADRETEGNEGDFGHDRGHD